MFVHAQNTVKAKFSGSKFYQKRVGVEKKQY